MDDVDKENLKNTLDGLIEQVVTLNNVDGFEDSDLVETLYILQESVFVLSGIIYSNGIPLGDCGHEKDEFGNCINHDED